MQWIISGCLLLIIAYLGYVVDKEFRRLRNNFRSFESRFHTLLRHERYFGLQGNANETVLRPKSKIDGVVKNILVFKPDHIGDVILAVPALYLIRELFAEANITFLGSPFASELVRRLPCVNHVVVFSFLEDNSFAYSDQFKTSGIYEKLMQQSWDLSINLRIQPDAQTLFEALPRARYQVTYVHNSGMVDDVQKEIFTHPIPLSLQVKHVVLGIRDLVEELNLSAQSRPIVWGRNFSGFRYAVDETEIFRQRWGDTMGSGKLLIGVHPFCRQATRTWDGTYYQQLIAKIKKTYPQAIFFVFGSSEDHLGFVMEDVIECVGLPLPEVAWIIARLAYFIGNNSGLIHLASLLDVATFAIFSGVELPIEWGPFGNKHASIRLDMACMPCHRIECNDLKRACLTQLLPEQVFEALKTHMSNSLSF